ncbi:hypothetical protein ABZ442_01235 [Streptomyces triculaminicus]|uniref:hypothetical protein n=1 Tax=Streptomyces triculaminicus TaxID=2816232 RepID=UPI0033D61153
MNVRRNIAAVAVTAALGGGLALAAPAATAAPASGTTVTAPQVQERWYRQWGPVDISQAYLRSHNHRWDSSGHQQPGGGLTMARGAISCTGKGSMSLEVRNVSQNKKDSAKAGCNGKKNYATVAARQGDVIKFTIKGSKATKIEAWAG